MATNAWKTLASRYTHKNHWYKVREDSVIMPSGKQGVYNVIEAIPSVHIIPITSDNKVVLVNLFRYPTQVDSWEIPAGHIEPGEEMLVAAQRELQEEIGMTARNWEKIASFGVAPGISDCIAHVLIAQDLQATNNNNQEEEGITEMKSVTFSELRDLLAKNTIVDGPTISALLFAHSQGYITI